jgi:hypothetical protein
VVQSLNTKKSLKLLSLKEIKLLSYDFWKRQSAIDSGHFDNLVYDDGKHRVWVSRMTAADYDGDRDAWMSERLTIEKKSGGSWVKA